MLYELRLDEAIKVALEINNKTLVQCYGDNNSKCPTKLMKYVRTFCKKNDFKLGKYA